MNKILKERKIKVSKYVDILERSLLINSKIEKYHSFSQSDYVSILAINKKKKFILVKQFRPALKKFTLELPGGLRDKNEKPKDTAFRELYEETGYIAKNIKFLGSFSPDSGRLSNKIHCFFSDNLNYDKNHKDEKGVKSIHYSKKNFLNILKKNRIQHFLHVGIIYLAIYKKLIKL